MAIGRPRAKAVDGPTSQSIVVYNISVDSVASLLLLTMATDIDRQRYRSIVADNGH